MDASALSALRRFHFGDPQAPRTPLPEGLRPALRPPAAAEWPLVVAPDAADEGEFAAPLGERQAESLSDDARLVELDRDAPWTLLDLAARRRLARAGAAFADESRRLAASADALLAADRGRRPEEVPAEERAGTLGPLGGRLLDPERLSGVVARRRAGEPLPAARRAGLEAARELLAGFGSVAVAPHWIVAQDFAPLPAGLAARAEADPLAAAVAAHEATAAPVVALARAARRVLLEESGAFDAGRHEAWLAQLDWRALSTEESGLVAPVLVVLAESGFVASGLDGWSRLLLSGRPLQVVVVADDAAARDAGHETRFEPATFAFAHREVFVHQGSPARPRALARGFVRALAGGRPALHVLDLGPAGGDGDLAASAALRLAARALPAFTYAPEAGGSWAKRLRLEDNPAPDADWPTAPFEDSVAAAGATGEGAITFADAALLDPAWHSQFAEANGSGEDLTPLAVWLELEGEQATRRLPFVWAVASDGSPRRLVVGRALALAARDRRDSWRNLSELAGVRSEHVAAAAERTRRELEARHAAELERTRAEAVGAAIDRLVTSLLEPLRQAPAGEPAGRAAALLAAELMAGPRPAPAATSAPAAKAPSAAVAVATPAAGAGELEGDAWVDSALCTSCDECVRKVSAVFAYNADKQAYVKNPRGGSWKDIVRAAEACPAAIIHPGAPWNPNEPGLAGWIERARKFA